MGINNGLSSLERTTTDLPRLVLSDIERRSNVLIVGKRHGGKSNYLAYLLKYHFCTDDGFRKVAVFSDTEDDNHAYEGLGIDVEYIRSVFDGHYLDRLIRMQKYIRRKLPSKEERNKLKHWLLIIMDDLGYDQKSQKNKTLSKIMMNGRHFGVVVIQLIQESYSVLKKTRGQYDYVICTRDRTIIGRKSLLLCYFGEFTEAQFKEAMQRYCVHYGVLISDCTARAMYLWDRAPNMDDENTRLSLDYSECQPFRNFLLKDTTGLLKSAKAKLEGFGVGGKENEPLDMLDMELLEDVKTFFQERRTTGIHARLVERKQKTGQKGTRSGRMGAKK